MMKSYLKILFLLLCIGGFCVSCKPMSQAQKASKVAKKRYKYIKHDCNCHAYLFEQNLESAEL